MFDGVPCRECGLVSLLVELELYFFGKDVLVFFSLPHASESHLVQAIARGAPWT